MAEQATKSRKTEAEVDPMFIDRWSPVAFSRQPVPGKDLAALFEAARWAPSCFNEQPWLFLYATQEKDLARFRSLLVEGNRVWADRAPVLAVVFARRRFQRNAKPNRHAAFDAGAAWMSLALQARRLGLYTHAMAGFDEERSYRALDVPKDRFEAMAVIAIGRRDEALVLPGDLAKRELPSDRGPIAGMAIEGNFPGI